MAIEVEPGAVRATVPKLAGHGEKERAVYRLELRAKRSDQAAHYEQDRHGRLPEGLV